MTPIRNRALAYWLLAGAVLVALLGIALFVWIGACGDPRFCPF